MPASCTRISDELYAGFHAWHTGELGHSPVTADNYIVDFRRFATWIALRANHPDLTLDDVTSDRLRQYLLECELRGLAKRTRKRAVLAVRSVFDYAIGILHYEAPNPGRIVKTPKVAKMNFPRPLSREEIRRLLDMPPPAFDGTARIEKGRARHMRDRFAIRFLLETGLRTSEFVALRLGDFHLDDRRVHVRCGKNQQARNCILSPALVKETLRYMEDIRPWLLTTPTERFWPGARESAPAHAADALRDALRAYTRRAGIQGFHPHRLRATCARMMAESGISLRVIQQHLGHSDISITAGYIAAFTADQEIATEEVFAPGWWHGTAARPIPVGTRRWAL